MRSVFTPQILGLCCFVFITYLGIQILSINSNKVQKIKLKEMLPDSQQAQIDYLAKEAKASNSAYGRFYEQYVAPHFERNAYLTTELARKLDVDFGELNSLIYQAHMGDKITAYEAYSIQLIGTLVFFLSMFALIFSLLLGSFSVLWVVITVGGFLVSKLPMWILKKKGKERRAQIEKDLPDFLDLLSAVLEAGLVIQEALNKVTAKVNGPLSEEFKEIQVETKASGGQWHQAMEGMVERMNIETLSSTVGNILIAHQKGTSIVKTVNTQAKIMREIRNTRIEEEAQKLNTKLLLPIIFFMFIPLIVILMFPMFPNMGGM